MYFRLLLMMLSILHTFRIPFFRIRPSKAGFPLQPIRFVSLLSPRRLSRVQRGYAVRLLEYSVSLQRQFSLGCLDLLPANRRGHQMALTISGQRFHDARRVRIAFAHATKPNGYRQIILHVINYYIASARTCCNTHNYK